MTIGSFGFLGLVLALLAKSALAQNPYSNADGGDYAWAGYPGSDGDGDDDGDGDGYRYGYGPGSSPGSAGGGLSGFTNFDVAEVVRSRTAHGIIAALCFVVIFPVGAIFVRTIPSRHTWLIHALIQGLGFILYVAAAGLGIHMIEVIRIPPDGSSLLEISSTNAHPIIGIVLLIVMFIQPPLGIAHHSKFKRLRRRTSFSYAHLWLGRISITLGIINGGLGLKLANASRGLIIAYSIVSGFAWLLWVIFAVVGELRRRKKNSNEVPREGIPPNNAPPPPFTRDGHQRRESSSNDPSPPYTPGPLYGGPPVYGGQPMEMVPPKNVRRSGSVSSFSSELVPSDGRRR
ncbi:hypothetical protein F5Y11DRAFT_339144 [Daldinia sp. FL1419]|nr:hypothetical protein F5Y11DRAFT_339144 [Daldinia sp. FL1419]